MKTLTIALLIAIALPLAVYQSSEIRLKQRQRELAAETRQATALTEENRRLKGLSRVRANPFSAEEAAELAKLRNEISQSRNKLKETNRLTREIARLQSALENGALESEADNPTALMVDEIPVRLQRLKQLKQWLEENPYEKIPELALLSEDSWIRSADRQRVADEDLQQWMVANRANAQVKFAGIAFKALKEYAAANNNQFPTDLAELHPYLKAPADPTWLDRYEIVPVSSLPQSLRETGDDWVISHKAPVNERYDARVAIGLAGHRATFDDGRWKSPSE
jgi:hypothetical protein